MPKTHIQHYALHVVPSIQKQTHLHSDWGHFAVGAVVHQTQGLEGHCWIRKLQEGNVQIHVPLQIRHIDTAFRLHQWGLQF